jgi:hypothetical protein
MLTVVQVKCRIHQVSQRLDGKWAGGDEPKPFYKTFFSVVNYIWPQ